VKAGNNTVDGILMKDLLKKYNLKANNVILMGPRQSAALTWNQANVDGLYVILNKQQRFLIFSTAPELDKIALPRRLIRITVAAKADQAATGQQSKPATK